jgi:LysM repeat protein
MNTPNPLVPQGTFSDKGKSHIRITVFAILAVHVVLLGVLLIAGCNKKAEQLQDTALVPPVPPPPTDPWPTPSNAPPAAHVAQDATHPAPTAPVAAPDTTAPPAEPVTGNFTEHTIAKGDSFYTLGRKYNVGFKAIADANPGVNPNRLKIGDKVKIPPPKLAGSSAPSGTAAAAAGEGGARTYKVKSGDSLMKIAKAQGVSLNQLRSVNNLRTDQIKVGQTLKIPVPTAAAAEPAPPIPGAPPPVASPVAATDR